MKKKVLMVSLSMVMVLGVTGIVNATTIGNNGTNMQSKASNAQAYMAENNNVTSAEAEQEETSPTDQTVPSETNNYDQMMNSNASMIEQRQNMPINTKMQTMPANNQMQTMPNNNQMQNMPMNTQMSEQMNTQHTQATTGTNLNNSKASQQSAQKSSSNNRMRSMGGMGR